MCNHFDPYNSSCNLKNEAIDYANTEKPINCNKRGYFLRNVNVLPSNFNYFADGDSAGYNWRPDYSKLSKDDDGFPLFVYTKRGAERAILANESVTLKGDEFTGVKRILTFQGQREAIRELGVELAKKEAAKANVDLTILPGEENEPGDSDIKAAKLFRDTQTTPWVRNDSEEDTW